MSAAHLATPTTVDSPGLPRLLGGRLCLDFVNTVDPRHRRQQVDYLPDFGALVRWSEHAGVHTAGEREQLLRAGSVHPAAAARTLTAAHSLRDALYQLFRAAGDGRPPPRRLLRLVNQTVTEALLARRLTRGPQSGLVWQWTTPLPVQAPLLRVALSAEELLTSSSELARVRECPGVDGCGWLFLDTSKSGGRRWCSMKVCGNLSKVRHYRAAGAAAGSRL